MGPHGGGGNARGSGEAGTAAVREGSAGRARLAVLALLGSILVPLSPPVCGRGAAWERCSVRMRYEFCLTGRVSASLAEAFPELERVLAPQQTLFFGAVTDEAQLYGLLVRFQDLGLRVEEMRRLPD